MADIDLAVQTNQLALSASEPVSAAFATKTTAGANLTLTGAAFAVSIYPTADGSGGPMGGLINSAVTLISALAGSAVLGFAATTANTSVQMSYLLTVTPSGGTAQTLASGQCTIK
jgi:hypothetical protein